MEVRGIWEQVGEGFSAVCRLRADVRVFISPRVVIRVFISPRVVIRVVISAWYVNQHIRRSFSSPYRRGSMVGCSKGNPRVSRPQPPPYPCKNPHPWQG